MARKCIKGSRSSCFIFRNYLSPFRVDLPGQGHLDGDQGIAPAVGHGLQVAGDAAVGLGILRRSEATGHLLLDLAHSQIAFGPVMPRLCLRRVRHAMLGRRGLIILAIISTESEKRGFRFLSFSTT
jgi:hypothetical protein